MSTAVLLIDIQNDYFPNGRLALEKSNEACQKIQEVLQACRAKEMHRVYMQHVSTNTKARHLLPCTKGVEIHPSVQPTKNETVIKKHYPNSFRDTNLLSHLQKHHVKHLIIVGMMTHMAIDATVRAAYDLNFTCTVLSDACATMNLEFNNMLIPAQTVHNAFLAALQPLYSEVLTVKEWLNTSVLNKVPVEA